jgi:hypothetical protein
MFFQKKLTVFLIAVLLLSLTLQSYGKSMTWNTYSNARFGYEISYPDLFFTGEEAQNGDGKQFVSGDGKAVLTVYASYNALNLSLDKIYSSNIAQYKKEGKKITYKIIDSKWFILSGYDGDKVFYIKTVRKHLGEDNDVDATFIITYPKSQKSTFDKITEKIANSLKFI